MKQWMHKCVALAVAGATALSLGGTALADSGKDWVIDHSRTGSLSVVKYDMTRAQEDGVNLSGLVATGQEDSAAETLLKDYTLGGVEFSYLRLGGVDMYSDGDGENPTVQVIYAVDNETVRETLGLSQEDAVKTQGGVPWYASDTLVDALEEALGNNRRATKDALEGEMEHSGSAMPLTDDLTGETTVSGLELGLYLVVETKVPENVTTTVNPFLVSLPMTDTQSADSWEYDVTVYPKNETGSPTLEKEVADLAHGVSFSGDTQQQGYRDVATGSAGDTMGYRFISTLPTITSQATHLTQYRFEDVLSPGLEYEKNQVTLCWYESYEKACADYTLATPGQPGTFGANAQEVWTCNDAGVGTYFDVRYADGENGSTTMTLTLNEEGLRRANTPADPSQQEGRFSDWTCVVYYTTKVNANQDLVLGDEGNPNEVTLTWSRTSQDYVDTLTDQARVYSYGIHLTKRFSHGGSNYDAVQFVVENVSNATGRYYVVAQAGESKGEYYATGTTTDVQKATRMSPNDNGDLYLYGLEEDTYQLTEVQTDGGYTLLEDEITVDVDTHYTPGGNVGSLTATATVDGYDAAMEPSRESDHALVPLTVLNTRGFQLPQMGGVGGMMTVAAGALLALTVGVRYAWKKRKG